MEKTQKVLKKFVSFILTFVLSFGSYVFPVFAALPDDNDAPTIEEVVDAYEDLIDQKEKVTDKIDEINLLVPTDVPAKVEAVASVEAYLTELDDIFTNKISGVDTPNTLKVVTTEYNVITVIVDFNDLSDTTNLGISLTNETMKAQVLKDTYSMLQEYCYQLEFVYNYLEQSETYTKIINAAGNAFDDVSHYVQILKDLGITFDDELYETYQEQLATLMIADDDLTENTTKVEKLIEDLKVYDSSIKEILRNGLKTKFNELKNTIDSSTLEGTEITNIKSDIATVIIELDTPTCDLDQLLTDYEDLMYDYHMLVVNNPNENFVDGQISNLNELLSKTQDLDLTKEQIDIIVDLVNSNNVVLPEFFTMEELISVIDADALSEKLISGELDYEALDSFVNLNNTHSDLNFIINDLKNIVSSNTDLTNYLNNKIDNGIFGENGGYIQILSNIKNESKTDEERLEILNKLDLIEYSLEMLIAKQLPSSNELVTPITDKIEELREFYNKSCDNTLTNLTVNGIELDTNESNHKIYVGNNVTELQILFERSNPNSKVEILNGKDLKVGSNEVIVIVTAENGEVRQYTLEVVRAEEVVATTMETTDTDDVETITLNNSVVEDEETIKEEIKNTSDSALKYNEEVEEDGLNGLTVLLIVIGIALVGFGVYKIFGEKEDQKIEKAFEQPKTNKPKSSTSKNNKNKKRK